MSTRKKKTKKILLSSDDEEKNDDTNKKNNRQKRRLKSFTMPANATKDFIFQSGGKEKTIRKRKRKKNYFIEKSLAPRRKFQIEKTNTKKDGFRDNSRRNDEKAF